MNTPSEQEFLTLSKKGNLIPVFREILGDLDTPVSAYNRMADRARYSFLLESVEGEEKIARYSFLAKDPEIVVKITGKNIEVTSFQNAQKVKKLLGPKDSPFNVLREILKKYRFVLIPGLPRFCGGLVGFLSYDAVRFFERLPDKPPDDLNIPELYFILAKRLVIFDHRNHTIKLVNCVFVPEGLSLGQKRETYRRALNQLDVMESEIRRDTRTQRPAQKSNPRDLEVESNFTKQGFEKIVRMAKTQIQKGEIIQVVLSQRFRTKLKTDPFHLYRMLRTLNPSPYMYFLNFDGIKIIGSSPELLVRCEDRIVETRPIAGTRPRGKDEMEDQRLIKELLDDPKENAEHIMLVDLGRNDLGRVCEQGSVQVTEFMGIERYSHVLHIVSNVRGKLKKGKDVFHVLEAAFPAGTVTGAPKIRAMEIIDGLENVARGPYAGCVGYFSFSGNLDTCITIRTIVVKGKAAYIQAGAGIVADSVPSREYRETQNKARAQIMAMEKAHELFDRAKP